LDQTFECIYWPATHEFKRGHWSGSFPDRTIAIAHTHLFSSPHASPEDRREAQRIAMPIFVISPRFISVIHADGPGGDSVVLVDMAGRRKS
jgi:hypothetical protein